ncbi:hypothetical protein BC332_19752 [Capsicum chinense]|nr:hypothetical protein BC332_19752 [Capsicum chinense]
MNRDLGPSFSLGVSQLESIKESHEVVNFIFGSFDYEFVDFDENRLKHRNYSQIMKKLWQKHSKDKKKNGSKKRGSNSHESKTPDKRRRIVEVIFRDELPKKYKNKNFPSKRYTTIDYFFKVYIDKEYVNYYDDDAGNELATQDASAKTDEVADMKTTLINTIKGFSPRAAVYAEYLSEGLDIPSSEIDAHYHRLRYVSILCKYGSVKVDNGYFSENDNPPRPRMKFTPKETDRVLRIR